MKTYDATLVDPSVTPEEIEQAHYATPADFPEAGPQDELDDLAEARALVGVIPATPGQALGNARQLRDEHTFVGVGMCLRTVRGPIFGVPALWPDAQAAMDHSAPFTELRDPLAAPRGSVGFASNGGHGHVWLNLGGGLASTTDFHETGFCGVALISHMLDWCNASRWGWGERLNDFDVWPDPKKPKPEPKPWGLAEREREVHRALRRARQNDAPQRRVDELKRWDETLVARLEARGVERLGL